MRDFITVIQCPFTELIKRYVYRRFRFGEVCRLFYSFQYLLKIDPSSQMIHLGKKLNVSLFSLFLFHSMDNY